MFVLEKWKLLTTQNSACPKSHATTSTRKLAIRWVSCKASLACPCLSPGLVFLSNVGLFCRDKRNEDNKNKSSQFKINIDFEKKYINEVFQKYFKKYFFVEWE